MPTRESAIARACAAFDSGAFRDRLAGLIAVRSTSQDPGHEADVQAYLQAFWAQALAGIKAAAENDERDATR